MDDKPDFLDRNPDPEAEQSIEAEAPDGISLTGEPPSPSPAAGENGSKPIITFQGNSYDLTSVVGLTTGAVVLLACATCNLGYYCLPFVPIILGIIGLVAAKDSVDPDRTKLLSWLSVGSGAIILLLIFIFVALYIGFIVFVVLAENGGF
jgi:hypothetical protein